MRPGDTGTDMPSGRPDAAKFLPYNLTAPSAHTQPTGPGWTLGSGVQLSAKGGAFTAYPTQSGAYFQWANEGGATRYAWDPFTAAGSLLWDNVKATTFWISLSSNHETCPPGYKRPNDGSIFTLAPNTSTPIVGSEMRQSLWLNPQSGNNNSNIDNFVWGYYADGFFDRRQIGSGPGIMSIPATAVSTTGEQVAYIGGLFYNPANYASLFFPAAGNRAAAGDPSGVLVSTGAVGYYWTSSVEKLGDSSPNYIDYSWNMSFGVLSPVLRSAMSRSVPDYGLNIRCVHDPCIPIEGVSLSVTGRLSSGAAVPTNTISSNMNITLSAAISPAGASSSYEWRYSTNGGASWTLIATTTTPTLATATLALLGTVIYSVTVSNTCSPPKSDTESITMEAPQRLTWDIANSRYILTGDPRDAGLYFRFGSVVGIFSGHGVNLTLPQQAGATDAFHAVDIAWSPVAISFGGTNADNWENVPYVSAHPTVINTAFHTVSNVKAGLGDPCRLIGLDLADIISNPNPVIDNGMWRLPTNGELDIFHLSSPTGSWWAANLNPFFGIAGAEFPQTGASGAGRFLPANGIRGWVAGTAPSDGNAGFSGSQGRYWGNQTVAAGTGASSGFNSGSASGGASSYPVSQAFGIRCVKQ